ncbi:hypothetical protein Kpol_1018p164 [Vanderwaltozyma polyspora DSM 70294]|uniref:Uncharacterized protein n=1 Tax=Vanderwaltozyma polyspora (strain ATCC 22028 / DSM 70294 / BCRC 21397 / CBS 2163 / NBRC 10782 / NRRL Y-8283 / UCD 57-17) TaxID=436907 RepID=A7TE04_VANPO|nr:uncharacterized protein Kpol_1018p164 [Vanderwaltozyma polyspora DSM 70294]EDO19624.1 hypothetical protein Kpol_1018p164 [Vanderwaltozyma polyspora DSM 70294]
MNVNKVLPIPTIKNPDMSDYDVGSISAGSNSGGSIDIDSNSESENDSDNFMHPKVYEKSRNRRLSDEYPADIQPLMFRMTLPLDGQNNNTLAGQEGIDSLTAPKLSKTLSKVKRKLVSIPRSEYLNSRNGMYWFSSIDESQLEKHLREPSYIKVYKKRRDMTRFNRLFMAQELKAFDDSNGKYTINKNTDNSRAIWVTKFSKDGKLMATAGKDGCIRIWKVISSPVERWEINGMQESTKQANVQNVIRRRQVANAYQNSNDSESRRLTNTFDDIKEAVNLFAPVFKPLPVRVFQEHSQDILDLDWSKNGFILTSSMDKTVKLWHPDRAVSLRTFKHPDFVSSVRFHPHDDRFFISGCLDHKLRVWSILDEEVSFEYDCQDLITAISLSPNNSEYTVVGTLNGYIHVVKTRGLSFVSAFHVRERHELSKGPGQPPIIQLKRQGPRITGLQCFYPDQIDSLRILATCDDSRIRVIRLSDRKLLEYLKGFHSGSTQHQAQLATVSNRPVVISGSDDQWIYGWTLQTNVEEDAIQPIPKSGIHRSSSIKNFIKSTIRKSCDFGEKLKSEATHLQHLHIPNVLKYKGHNTIRNSAYVSFRGHLGKVTTAVIAPPEVMKTLSLSNDFICELSMEYFTELENSNEKNLRPTRSTPSSQSAVATTLVSTGSVPSKTSLNGQSPLPPMIEVVGTVIVSTDNLGIIRVFRVDLPSRIRKMILQKLVNAENNLKEDLSRLDLSVSTSSKADNSTTKGTNSLSLDVQKSCLLPNGTIKSSLFGTQSNNSSVPPPAKKIPSISSSSTLIIDSQFKQFPSNALCDVCNGTRFQFRPDDVSSGGGAYYCTDCNTVYNSFR